MLPAVVAPRWHQALMAVIRKRPAHAIVNFRLRPGSVRDPVRLTTQQRTFAGCDRPTPRNDEERQRSQESERVKQGDQTVALVRSRK